MSFLLFVFLAILHVHLTAVQAAVAGGGLIFEDGYTVSTVLDGDKSNIKVNPHSILHQSPPSDLYILLDSAASTFYTLSLSTTSNGTGLKRLAGNGESGYADGDLDSSKFDRPGSFAVDFNGNVYVADYRNHAIRKITKSGVTTIAGGYSQKDGRTDGLARNASFSNNFELTFVPRRCALMISDHGNRLLRQINLKAADCKHSGSVLGTTSAWLLGLGLGLSCLLSLVVGFVIRPYIMPYGGVKPHRPSWTWTHCRMNLGRQIMILCSDIKNGIVKSTIYSLFHQVILLSLSQLSLMFRPLLVESRSCTIRESPVSLLDLDEVDTSSSGRSVVISPRVSNQLKDLLTFDGGSMLSVNSNETVEQEDESYSSSCDGKSIDGMIQANLMKFEMQAPRCSQASPDCSLGLVKRR
ncbi:hypothetical protein ACS0TY_010204 [Phlomoides rotata]